MSASPIVAESRPVGESRPTGPGLLARGHYLFLALARRLEALLPSDARDQWRSSRAIPKILKLLFCSAAFGLCFWGFFSLLRDERPLVGTPGSDTLVAQIADLNFKVGRDALRRDTASVRYHGDLSQIPKPGNWSHPTYADDLRFPLDREPQDFRLSQCKGLKYGNRVPKTSVVFIFCNEPFETLLRSVHSALNTSPPDLLDEIILVDDGSDRPYIKSREDGGTGLLEDYIALLPKVRLIRTGERSGIVRARLTGINAVKSETFVILDSHIECQPGWLEPLLYPIGSDPSIVTMPHIDGIDKSTLELQKGGVGCTIGLIWNVMEHAYKPEPGVSPADRVLGGPTDYVSSPTMAGGLFAANKEWFLKIGGYDTEMSGWGAENVEFSFRLWQCGGKLLCTECSRVNHMFGGGKHYKTKGGSTSVNRMRTIASWMDQFADLSWHVLGRPKFEEIGNLTRMNKLRKELQCKGFKWFLDNVYPESYVRDFPDDVPYLGPIVNIGTKNCLRQSYRGANGIRTSDCSSALQGNKGIHIYWKKPSYITVENNDETCLVLGKGDKSQPKWDWCSHNVQWTLDLDFISAGNDTR
ncbi:putative UDP-N-acetyl-D-galactosamine:polypeptide N-acetylgalactosaminyltransferase [Gregarina niphandrodes]|uniref:UDP-N-acetyl-D-galactosamine:polypeptide N-acetylgalactosaminyltransferase n=1 Tax=Gregarina niphandrodes TaxID=110365 RepID=A0A023B1L4_GRENI|nr:putative UDP-N-acetyl-D-galactosamine:polypeptide N-acetylgalactosaminyltransferase [Gregarina niphandrodes]EZG46942.1 putative UDP-N-acetyl-D-galactosamine:polypeptide N-acetylgalactosaminyltransferase [Gregarina niphandrodes]|eukprot:XP_011132217.1 putative UDP-N-acetyl-D-galactosamine:polypeptide N-acetylgalactosaminyltransferase [Gregarina niphandrodes]